MFPVEPPNWESVEASEYASRLIVEAKPAFFTGAGTGAVLFVAAENNEVVPGDQFYEGTGFFIADPDATYLDVLRKVFSPISTFDVGNVGDISVPEYGWDEVLPSEVRGNYATEDEARAAAQRLVRQGVPVGVVIKPNGYWAVVVTSS